MSGDRTVACLQSEGHAPPRGAGRETGSFAENGAEFKGCRKADIRGEKGTLFLLLSTALYERFTTFIFAFCINLSPDLKYRMLKHLLYHLSKSPV